jgi:hypothetical protein
MERPSAAKLHVKWAFTLGLLALGVQLAAQNPQNQMPSKPRFENDQVVINPPQTPPWPGAGDSGTDIPKSCATLPPQDKEWCAAPHNWHNHKLNRVMIYLQTGGERLVFLDGSTEVLRWEPGEVKWSPAAGFHYSDGHWSSGPGSAPYYVAIKKPGYPGKVVSTALDPLRVDPKDFTLELENSQVRVLRLKMGPRQSVPMHEYSLNHVVVYVTDQNVRETSPEGKAEVAQHKAADFSWSGPSKQKVDNLNDRPFEAVIVELKTIY